jgi:ABC-type nitrate/sulfonate/bicarbonate transport system substrate-binding protein
MSANSADSPKSRIDWKGCRIKIQQPTQKNEEILQEKMHQTPRHATIVVLTLLFFALTAAACGDRNSDRLPLTVSVKNKSMSKLPFVIAWTQGLYEKHGLNVDFLLDETPRQAEARESFLTRSWRRVGRRLGLVEPNTPDIIVAGHGPSFILRLRGSPIPAWVALAATDCSVRDYVIARPGIGGIEELRGKRLGINDEASTSGYAGLRLLERMGWERGKDVSIVRPAGVEELENGIVDAIVGGDEEIEAAERSGYPVLEDTRRWNERLAGNSALVAPGWLREGMHREAARRFLKATIEAVALFHERPDLVMEVMASQYGITDRAIAEARYRRADYVPRKPFPCREGVEAMLKLHHLEEMHEYALEDFYDDSLMRELDESGFIDGVYQSLAAGQ